MTDKEIIKAFKCCHCEYSPNCESCPNEDTCEEISVTDSILDLINRQRIEIRRLNSKLASKDRINDYKGTQLMIARGKLKKLKQENAESLEKIKDDLQYYLDNNEQNGVVYIPKFVVEKIITNINCN